MISFDEYPDYQAGQSMAVDLQNIHKVFPHAAGAVSEWGATSGGSEQRIEQVIVTTMNAFKRNRWIVAVNYWNFVGGGDESLIETLPNGNFKPKPIYAIVQRYFGGP